MKSYGKDIFEKITDKENIRTAIIKSSLGKRHRKDVQKVLSQIDKYVDKIHKILTEQKYRPKMTKRVVINKDNKSHKQRNIRKPKYVIDQIVHHAVIQVIKPIIMKRLVFHAYGSVPGRGLHKASKYINTWLKDYKKSKYCLKLDIKHFYSSIDKDILKAKISKIFRDQKVCNLINIIIDSFEETGVPLGYYTSQWFAMIYLYDFDHYVKEILGQKYYVRYMDDIVLICSNKRKLWRVKKSITAYLNDKLKLPVKSNWQIFPIAYCKNNKEYGRPLDFLGYLFYHYKKIVRKKNLIALVRKTKKVSLKLKINTITKNDCASVISRTGLFHNSHTFHALKCHVYSLVNMDILRSKVSEFDKQLSYDNLRGVSICC